MWAGPRSAAPAGGDAALGGRRRACAARAHLLPKEHLMPSTRYRSAMALAALAATAGAAGAQTSRHNVSGDSVAIYNIVGEVRIEGGTGSAVTVEVTRTGRDAEQLRIE